MLSWQQQREHTPSSMSFSRARAGHSSPRHGWRFTLFLPLLFLSVDHNHIRNCSCFQPSISFLSYFTTFSVSSTCLRVIPLSTAGFSFLFRSPSQLPSHSGLFAWWRIGGGKKDADRASRARTAPLCPSRPGLRFVMLDNARQRGDKISTAANKKSLVFFFYSFPFPTADCISCMNMQSSPGHFFKRGRHTDIKVGKMSSQELRIWFV